MKTKEFVAARVKSLPQYIFSEFNKKKLELQKQGIDIIDLGIGAPDLPTPPFVLKTLFDEVQNPENHRYSPYQGIREFREAVSQFYKTRYNVDLDPEKEVLMLIGSKEGIYHFIHTVIDQGDGVLLPNPGYPVYRIATQLAGGKIFDLPLTAENNFIPDLSTLSTEQVSQSKLMLLNFPANPTAATVDSEFFAEAIHFAKNNNLIVANDAAYDLVTFQDYIAPSLLQVPGAKDVAIEFGSLSKSFNMTGWRIGYAVGNSELIQALARLKSNIDTAQFIPIQKAASVALTGDFSTVQQNNREFAARMELMYRILVETGFELKKPRGTFYLWVKVPEGYSSLEFAGKLMEEAGIIVTPGNAFGSYGEGYFRIALTVAQERLLEAGKRLKNLSFV
ncbi:MAG: LL-diaminopimelate aminotransferase [Caldibacillus sp.]